MKTYLMRIALLISLLLLPPLTCSAANRALIIGLGKQQDERWSKIHGDHDVYLVEKLLRRNGYTDIRTLKNEQATKWAIVTAFGMLTEQCAKGDNVYIHYSGHGQLMTDLDGDEAARWTGRRHAEWDESWVPYDAYMTYCDADRGDKHLCDDELATMLTAIRSKIGNEGTLTVVVDACHSGDATCGKDEECVRGVDMKFNIPRTAHQPREASAALPENWLTISACKPYQLCTEMKELRVGKLTFAICKLGDRVFGMSNEELEAELNGFMERNKGRLPQNPMVTGRR